MRLEVHERLALIDLLPKEGSYAALKTIRRAREMLSFTPEEIKFYEMKSVMGANNVPQTNWSSEKAAEAVKDCPVDEYIVNLIRDKLAEMNKKGKITEQLMSIYEKFVIDYR